MRAQFHGGTNGTLGLGLILAMSYHRAACSTECPCSSDADWCIHVDGVCMLPSRPLNKISYLTSPEPTRGSDDRRGSPASLDGMGVGGGGRGAAPKTRDSPIGIQ